MTEFSQPRPIQVARTISRKAKVGAGGRIPHSTSTYSLLKLALPD